MNCQKCKNSPSFYCPCSSVYICEIHFGSHLTQQGEHAFETLSTIPSSERPKITTFFQNSIKSLHKLKQKILYNSKESIKFLASKTTEIISKINKQLKVFEDFLIHPKFRVSELEKMKSLMILELKTDQYNFNDLTKAIQKTYSQDFFDFMKDPRMELKNFLQTHNGGFWCLAVSKDGKTLIAGSNDSSVRVWDLKNANQVACLIEHKSDVRCLALSIDAKWAVSGSHDRTVIFWDLISYRSHTVYKGHLGAIFTVSLAEDSSFIVSGSQAKEIFLWKTDSDFCYRKINTDNSVYSGIILERAYFACVGSSMEIWNLNDYTKDYSLIAHDSIIRCAKLSNKKDFIITCSDDTYLQLFKINPLATFAKLTGHKSIVTSVALTDDDCFAVSGSVDYVIIIWNIIKN